MSTNVYCNLCEEEVGSDDSFVVETDAVVGAFHYDCGRKVWSAMAASLEKERARGRNVETTGEHHVAEMSDLAPLTQRIERLEAVWKLWLNEAEKGSISQGTFHTMKHLLGIQKEERRPR